MATSVKFSDDAFVADARAEAKLHGRSLGEQIVYWARIGRVIEKSESFDFAKIERVLAAEATTTTLTWVEKVVLSDMFFVPLSSESSEEEVARFEEVLSRGDSKRAALERFRGRLPAAKRLSRDESNER